MEPSWSFPGAFLGPSKSLPRASLGHSWSLREPSWSLPGAFLEPSGAFLEPSWSHVKNAFDKIPAAMYRVLSSQPAFHAIAASRNGHHCRPRVEA